MNIGYFAVSTIGICVLKQGMYTREVWQPVKPACMRQMKACACRQDEPASCLYVLISGRIRLIREDLGMRPRVRVEEEVGRGEAVGAVWALTGGIHDTTALCVRDSELVRMSKVSATQP